MTARKSRGGGLQWRLIDLHLHTPASSDYQESDVTFLDILRRCEARRLDIVSFTDHNTAAGYRQMREELQDLELLEKLGRQTEAERARHAEYRRLLEATLVLPGFEFTATFGFHVLAVFSPEKPVRELEHLLLSLNIPADQLDAGSSTVGATDDVLTAYRMIDEAGGLVIAAHANSSNGVAMRGLPFGGQTKIAYTQDPHLHVLEVTDLGSQGRRTTAGFFNGTKPEYPRRMHCIQGSDAHRLTADPRNKKNLGVGDRPTEVLLPEVSFEALRDLFRGNDFARSRPFFPASEEKFDFIQQARQEGPNIVQDFHESMSTHGGKLYAIIADVCAMANTNGGTLYLGVGPDPKAKVVGVEEAGGAIRQLQKEIAKRISPALACQVDSQETQGKTIIRILIPRGEDPPYAVDDNKVYLRDEAETGLAVRDEIVQLVLRGKPKAAEAPPPAPAEEKAPEVVGAPGGPEPPKTGVEVAGVEDRGGVRYYTMRDLRNGNVVKNVTESSARRLWHYAISQYIRLAPQLDRAPIQWQGDLGIVAEQKRGDRVRYDLAQRTPHGMRLFFGVNEDGIHGEWKRLVGGEGE